MKTRIISGCILAPFLILVILGGPFITAAVFLISLAGLSEFYKGFRKMKIRPSFMIGIFSILGLYALDIAVYHLKVFPEGITPYLYLLWLFLSVLASLLYMFNMEKRSLADGMATLTGIVYIAFFAYHAVLAENLFADMLGASPVWMIVISAFGTDIFAYFGGYFLGKHKLCPTISPKKTIEGSLSGMLASVILCTVFGWFFMDSSRLFVYAMTGLAGGIFSQFGDLTASVFKRKMGIKDYGNLIPGHGGIMDRFDSVLFTAPMVFYIMMIFYAAGI